MEESYARSQDPSTTLHYIYLHGRNVCSKCTEQFTVRMTHYDLTSKLETRSPVIPTEVEESYARPQDPSTALRYVQDDALFFLVTRNSPLLYSSIIFVKHVPQ